ncbi:6976_t:CDS:10 [Funneliformis geosporum]|uniref:6976_t:CDS:1 n=1 Tax=Funneliformis geosporum TaxID=1117311 RepID=A0A9W4WLE3_9GLOM|nr:6976_t:CDS:10 [Funneliformis geosporum]
MVFNRYGKFIFSKQRSILDLANSCGDGVQVNEEEILEGYQLYIVEQWACDIIQRPYNTVIVFTGDPTHQVKACVINIEDKIDPYPAQLTNLFNTLEQDNVNRIESDRGTIFVTNLSTFPSSLNIILVPDGDYEAIKLDFFLNLNLRKIGCSGRSALSLKPPTDTQKDKFLQTYTISDQIPFTYAVLELVKLVQISLYIFGLFPLEYTDGLLFDSTEMALKDFRNIYCPELEIRDNLLDPTLVANILRKVVSIRNKLNYLGYQVGKDPFSDTDLFLNGVTSFQKNAKNIECTRNLNPVTIKKIYEAHNRSRNSDAIKVHKVLLSKFDDMSKSTGSSSTTIDIETCNLEEFGKYVNIERLKYLWRGKGAPPEHFLETYWLFHGSKDFGIELGKSFLRGVSGRTAKTGEVIRDGVGMILGFKDGVTGSFSNLVDKRISKDREKITCSPIKSLSLPPGFVVQDQTSSSNEIDALYDQAKLAVRSSEPHIESDWTDNENSQNGTETYSSILFDHCSETELSERNEINEARPIPRRSNSLSTFDFINETMTAQDLPMNALSRHNSFTNIELARKQADGILPSLKRREASLKSLVKRMELTVKEYDKRIEELTKSYEERNQDFKFTETGGMEVLAKQKIVSKAITQIDTNSAKLNYELGVLEDKLKEIEEFVDTFCLKCTPQTIPEEIMIEVIKVILAA